MDELTEDEATELGRQATEIYASHGFSGHNCSVWIALENQYCYVCLETDDDPPLYCLGHEDADLAMENIDLFFEREAQYAVEAMILRSAPTI